MFFPRDDGEVAGVYRGLMLVRGDVWRVNVA